jgi:hypothetical protein
MSKFSCLFFGNPTNKSVTGTAYMWGLPNSKPPGPIIMIDNQKYWAPVRSNLLHSFLEVHNCVAPFTSHGKLHEFGAEKPISWAKAAHFDFFPINFSAWCHILNTVGDALRTLCIWVPQYSKALGWGMPHSQNKKPKRVGAHECSPTYKNAPHLWGFTHSISLSQT